MATSTSGKSLRNMAINYLINFAAICREFMVVLYVMSNGSPEENLKQVRKDFVNKLYRSKIWSENSVLPHAKNQSILLTFNPFLVYFQIFRVFDINNDGSVSPKELQRIVKDLFHLFNKEDNPERATQEEIALNAFKVCLHFILTTWPEVGWLFWFFDRKWTQTPTGRSAKRSSLEPVSSKRASAQCSHSKLLMFSYDSSDNFQFSRFKCVF